MWNFTFHSIAGLIQQYILQLLRHTGHQQIALIVLNLKIGELFPEQQREMTFQTT